MHQAELDELAIQSAKEEKVDWSSKPIFFPFPRSSQFSSTFSTPTVPLADRTLRLRKKSGDLSQTEGPKPELNSPNLHLNW